jgi:hypothetical protein
MPRRANSATQALYVGAASDKVEFVKHVKAVSLAVPVAFLRSPTR